MLTVVLFQFINRKQNLRQQELFESETLFGITYFCHLRLFRTDGNRVSYNQSDKKKKDKNYRAVCIQSEIPKLLDFLLDKTLIFVCKN